MHKQARFRRLSVGLMALPLGLMAAGCGSSNGTVSGKVSYKGQPVRGGTVTIVPEKGPPARGLIQEDGTYKIANVSVGPAKVAVETDSVKPAEAGGPAQAMGNAGFYSKIPKPPPGEPGSDEPGKSIAGGNAGKDEKRYVAIPKKYNEHDKSGLTLTVKGGNNLFDIDLKEEK